MNIGEVSSINSSFQGQGSQPKNTSTVSEPTAKDSVVSTPETQPVEITEKARDNGGNNNGDNKEGNQQNGQASLASLKKAVEKINTTTQNVEAKFGFHEATNRVTIKMVDKDTKETVKEFPAEETLDLIAKAWELAGIMVDERR